MRVEAGEVRDLLADRRVAGFAAGLQHDAQARLPGEVAVPRVDAQHRRLAAGAVAVALEDLDRRRLAGAVRAEEGERLAAVDVERDAGDGRRAP